VLQLVERNPTPMTRDEFQQAFQTFIRDPESGEAYGDSWVRRTISDLESAAVIRRVPASEASGTPRSDVAPTEELVMLWPTGEAFLAGEISFERFVWQSLKRGWVLEGNAPEKIEGLERVLKVLTEASGPMKKGAIEATLADGYDYEFSSTGIRGYPNVLLLMGLITRTDDGYVTTDQAESWLQKFRRVDLFRIFERWIQREGPTGHLPRETTKRDLAKYYMYRESGGWGKQSGWLKSFWREYLDANARNGDSARPSLSRAAEYVEADNERAALRDNIREKYDGIGTDQLSGLPTEILRRMDAAETEREAKRIRAASGSGVSRSDLELLSTSERSSYTFPASLTLYDWQQAAADQWFTDSTSEPEAGIAQVVTGAGKTVMALEVVRRWLNENPEGVVTVVVPTKVLMQQWLTEFVEKLNVPIEEIGWAGDGTRDSFDDGCRVLVSIVNTAVKNDFLRETLAERGNPPHLLIADECHRYTSDVFSNVFSYPRTASLGLSATPISALVTDVEEPETVPERADCHDSTSSLTPEDELLLNELGDIYYSLTYDQALERGLIPPFEVNYVRFELTPSERNQYEVLSRKVSDAVSDIEARYGDRMFQLSGPYAQKLNIIMNSATGPTPAISDFFEFTQKRRELVANAVSRQAITLDLLRGALDADEQSIVFQERIEQLEQLVAPHERRGRNPRTGELAEGDISSRQELYERYPALKQIDLAVEDLFDDPKFKPVMYHSGHSRARWNDFAMEWFRDDGFANTMLSVKALIEGVDVPSADVGIIRVSSSSLRQRIQTLGRVLRTGGDATKRSKLYVLYAKETVDENLFKKYDWDEQLASAEINHLQWQTTGDDPLHGRIEPTTDPLPTDCDGWEQPEIPDIDCLERGDPYPGPRRGFEFSVDSDGRPFRRDGDRRKYITNDEIEEVASYVRGLKGGGTVTINEANHMLTQTSDGPVFLGLAQDPEKFSYDEDSGSALTDEAPDSLDFM
jgi:superfamily II DNA or RNA helicase